MLACSTNNCVALRMLVCTRAMHPDSHICLSTCTSLWKITVQLYRTDYIAVLYTHCQPAAALSLTKNGLCLSSSPSISCLSKLKHGAKLCKQNKLGHFPIHAAAFAGAKKALEVILKEGTTKGLVCHPKLRALTIMKTFLRGHAAH